MSDLKPCPFCEKETYPELIVDGKPGKYWIAWYKCPECDCNQVGVDDNKADDPRQSAIDMAKERWNERYERTCRIEYKSDNHEGIMRNLTLSCGHQITSADIVRFCPRCGAKVVNE